MILTEHGCIYSFGYGAHGQLGIGVVQNKNKPSLVKSFLPPAVMGFNEVEEQIIKISLGQNHSLALSSSGYVYSCGS